MTGVRVGPSPEWLKNSLESIGARSINNIVDATNLVLFDDGQPVHAFDKDKIDGGIVVRLAHEGEHITTLSQEAKELKTSDLVIADYLGPLAVAGVKGGVNAEVSDTTTSIIVEIGNFDPAAVRKTSRRLSLVTDASKRFENEITPAMATGAAEHVVALIKEISGGEVVGVYDYYPKPEILRTISFTLSDIARLLGSMITEKEIDLWISRYDIVSKKEGNTYTITAPVERLDLLGAHDIAEDIGKMLGYESVPTSALPFIPVAEKESEYRVVSSVKQWLAQNGFREVQNYTFAKKGDVYVAYGARDKSALRTNLSEGLKESYEKNRLNAPLLGIDRIRLFEIGTVFSKEGEEVRVATCDSGMFEECSLTAFIEKYKITTSRSLAGSVSVAPTPFKMWSLYPFIVRDIAVWCESIDAQARLEELVSAFATQYCVREPVLFDRFDKDGKTSVAYRFVFQSYEKTLTEGEVEAWFAELVAKIQEEGGFEIR